MNQSKTSPRVLSGNPQSSISNQQSPITNQQSPITDSPWLTCPVCHDTRRISTLSKDMIRAIRKLRRDLKYCDSCSVEKEACPILQELNAQILTAVQTVVNELNLAG